MWEREGKGKGVGDVPGLGGEFVAVVSSRALGALGMAWWRRAWGMRRARSLMSYSENRCGVGDGRRQRQRGVKCGPAPKCWKWLTELSDNGGLSLS